MQNNVSMILKTKQWKSLKVNNKKRGKINQDGLRDFLDNIKQTDIHIIRVPEEKER